MYYTTSCTQQELKLHTALSMYSITRLNFQAEGGEGFFRNGAWSLHCLAFAVLTDAPLSLPAACTAGTLPERSRTDLSWPPSRRRATKKTNNKVVSKLSSGFISRCFSVKIKQELPTAQRPIPIKTRLLILQEETLKNHTDNIHGASNSWCAPWRSLSLSLSIWWRSSAAFTV